MRASPSGEAFGSSASSKVGINVVLTRPMTSSESQALAELWHGHDSRCCEAKVDGSARNITIPGIPHDEILSHYEFLRDLIAEQLPAAATRREAQGESIKGGVKDQLTAVRADIAARLP